MKRYSLVLFIVAFTFCSCTGQRNRILIRPDPAHIQEEEQPDPFITWQIIESKNGPGDAGIPEWVRLHYNNRFHGIESLQEYSGTYVFTGENRGESLSALQQWANGFSVQHDLPRLIAARVERKLVSAASLFPDDEYGQYFENLIKNISDGEFPQAVKGESFWIKRKVISYDEESALDGEVPQEIIVERYEFVVLISIDKETLQNQMREIMTRVRTTTAQTREQAARISRLEQTFFEGF